jgi:hypothetical protein
MLRLGVHLLEDFLAPCGVPCSFSLAQFCTAQVLINLGQIAMQVVFVNDNTPPAALAARLAQGCPPKLRRWVLQGGPAKTPAELGLALHRLSTRRNP